MNDENVALTNTIENVKAVKKEKQDFPKARDSLCDAAVVALNSTKKVNEIHNAVVTNGKPVEGIRFKTLSGNRITIGWRTIIIVIVSYVFMVANGMLPNYLNPKVVREMNDKKEADNEMHEALHEFMDEYKANGNDGN